MAQWNWLRWHGSIERSETRVYFNSEMLLALGPGGAARAGGLGASAAKGTLRRALQALKQAFGRMRGGSVAANAGDDVTRLYRAVDPAELKDIVGTGVYRSAPGGTEGKYFFPTKAQAENFSNLMGKTGTGPYCITSGCIPRSTLNGIETISPAGEGTAYFIPQNVLPQFRDIIIHGPQ